jgi:hypothetical protein
VRQQSVPIFIVTLALAIGPLEPAAPVIGTAVAKGAFRVDNAAVTGNATLFEGAVVETRAAGSSMELASGAKVSLASESKGKFFGDHMILERGEGQLDKAAGFRLVARGLTIQPETGNASARVGLAGAARVNVAAMTGSFRVLNSYGLLVANLAAGMALAFEPQGSSAPSRLTGCLEKRAGHFLLTDETTNVTVELGGPGLDRETGNRVEVSGSLDAAATPVTDASQFIRVSGVKRIGRNCVVNRSGTAAAGVGGKAGKTAKAGGAAAISTTTIAVIGGVAVAATVGGLAAGGALPGQGGGSSPSISR